MTHAARASGPHFQHPDPSPNPSGDPARRIPDRGPARTLRRTALAALLAAACGPAAGLSDGPADSDPASHALAFTPVQTEVFSAPGAQPNAWADYDNDGDLDLFVGFRGAPDRLYRNDDGVFVDVAPALGLDEPAETRAAAWGDFDGDGHLDLYTGFPASADLPNRLYRNDGDGAGFTEVAAEMGVAVRGRTTRQPVWLDYDQDGDLDLFVAFRDDVNRLFRNDGAAFTDVTDATGIGDPRRTVGAVWFDMDVDGDLDLFVANQNGDSDGFFRNDGGVFTDVAPELGMDWPDRPEEHGGVGVAVTDYDNDGDLDLFVAAYGPDILWQNQGNGTFVDVAPGTPLAGDHHSVTATWADVDSDGRPDLHVAAFLSSVPEEPDYLFRNGPSGFADRTPQVFRVHGASHGVAWADYDRDGDLDVAMANNDASGRHPLYRNDTAGGASLQVLPLGREGRPAPAGTEVRVLDAGSDRLLGTGLVDSGGGYCSQGVTPVHFGLGAHDGPVTVEVTSFARGRRQVWRSSPVDPAEWRGRPFRAGPPP